MKIPGWMRRVVGLRPHPDVSPEWYEKGHRNLRDIRDRREEVERELAALRVELARRAANGGPEGRP